MVTEAETCRKIALIEASIGLKRDYYDKNEIYSLSSVPISASNASNSTPQKSLIDPSIGMNWRGSGVNTTAHSNNNEVLIEVNDSPVVSLPSINKLVSDLTALLNEIHSTQRKRLTLLNKEIFDCCSFIEQRKGVLQSSYFIINRNMGLIHSGNDDSQLGANLLDLEGCSNEQQCINTLSEGFLADWDQLPLADDELHILSMKSSTSGSGSDNTAAASFDSHRKIELIRKKCCRQIEYLHNELQGILDYKAQFYRTMDNILHSYCNMLLLEGNRLGDIDHLMYRIHYIVNKPFIDLFSHKFFDLTEIELLKDRIENSWLTVNFHQPKEYSLRVLSMERSSNETIATNWLKSFKIGCGFILFLWAVSECFNNERYGRHIWNDPTFSIFMCVGDMLLLLWMWGVSIHVWRLHDIDFIKLLQLHGTELDHIHKPEERIYTVATDLTLIFLVTFILFNKTVRGVLDLNGNISIAHTLPLVMICYFIYRSLSPWNTRKKWWWMLVQVLCAPCYKVSFRCGYIGDILTSLVRVMSSIIFSLYYLFLALSSMILFDFSFQSSEDSHWWDESYLIHHIVLPMVSLIPLWIRLIQCLRRSIETGNRWPHIGNALKYTSAMSVISFGIFNPPMRRNTIWICCFIFATLFQFSWDLTMDWGIVVWSNSKYASKRYNFFNLLAFREHRLFGSIWVYISFMLANLVLRFAWILTLLPPTTFGSNMSFGSLLLYHLGPFIAAGEVLRRMVWGFYRLEYEQIEVFGLPESLLDLTAATTATAAQEPPLSSEMIFELRKATGWNFDWTIICPSLLSPIATITWFGLSPGSSNQQKARFLEAIVFVTMVTGLLLFAVCYPHLMR